jgi:carnitine O-acetyltransferase
MAGEVVEALKSPSFDHGASTPSPSLPSPTSYDFQLSPTLHSRIEAAKAASYALVSSQALTFLRTSYGKKTIKEMGYSPDSYAQMVIQLAYHRLLSRTSAPGSSRAVTKNGGTYEAATTRKFQHGRTEVIRVVSEESEAFCAAMDAFDEGKVGADAAKDAFAKAVKEHGQYARAAGNAQGVDRHLFGDHMFPFVQLRSDAIIIH